MSTNFASDRKFWQNYGAFRAPTNFESNFRKSWPGARSNSSQGDPIRLPPEGTDVYDIRAKSSKGRTQAGRMGLAGPASGSREHGERATRGTPRRRHVALAAARRAGHAHWR